MRLRKIVYVSDKQRDAKKKPCKQVQKKGEVEMIMEDNASDTGDETLVAKMSD